MTMMLVVLMVSCGKQSSNMVEITTPYGTMRALLYDDTPLHKENFLRLAEDGAYDSLLFHRVIRGFMVQGGDPNSLYADRSVKLGSAEIGEPIKSEILYPKHYHKRGALAAARKGDSVNPERKSSGSQFYIVHGAVYDSLALDNIELEFNNVMRRDIFYEVQPQYQDSLMYYQSRGMAIELSELQLKIMSEVQKLAEQKGLFKFAPEVREAYQTTGGAPQLDGKYTVFGELVEGFEVLDSIASVMTERPSDRPVEDIWMTVKVID
jgi:peptidyl-prolyl cis-trans isomerase B (cyclophilin B)